MSIFKYRYYLVTDNEDHYWIIRKSSWLPGYQVYDELLGNFVKHELRATGMSFYKSTAMDNWKEYVRRVLYRRDNKKIPKLHKVEELFIK